MGFAPAQNTTPTGSGLRFCNESTQVQLFDDPAGKTKAALTELLTEVAAMFPDPVLHLGGDETIGAPGYSGACTEASFRSLLEALQRHLQGLGKQPMGWNDLITRTDSAAPSTIIDAWTGKRTALLSCALRRSDTDARTDDRTGTDDNFTVHNSTVLGHPTVNSDNSAFYLMYQFGRNSSETWRDISLANGKPLVQPQRRLLLGGSVSVWTGDCKCRTRATAGFPARLKQPLRRCEARLPLPIRAGRRGSPMAVLRRGMPWRSAARHHTGRAHLQRALYQRRLRMRQHIHVYVPYRSLMSSGQV